LLNALFSTPRNLNSRRLAIILDLELVLIVCATAEKPLLPGKIACGKKSCKKEKTEKSAH